MRRSRSFFVSVIRSFHGHCDLFVALALGSEQVVHLGLDAALRTAARRDELHLHALLVEAMPAAQHQVVVAFLDEPLADEAALVLRDAALVNVIVLRLHLKVHLLNLVNLETLRGRRLHFLGRLLFRRGWLLLLHHDA